MIVRFKVKEPGRRGFGLWFPAIVIWILLAALAVFVQTISPHKFVGWGLMVLYLIASITLGNLGFDHILYTGNERVARIVMTAAAKHLDESNLSKTRSELAEQQLVIDRPLGHLIGAADEI
mgnify:CR=1 FL=1